MKNKVLIINDKMNNFNNFDKVKILFICKNNSIRSQIAEAIINSFYGETHIAFSGGTQVKNINKNTIKVLKEIDIDISNKKSKNIEIFRNMKFHHVITVCDDDNCHYFPNADNYINKNFKDPQNLSKLDIGILNDFKKVRDEIKEWIIEMVENKVI